jgi:hypothetical protein
MPSVISGFIPCPRLHQVDRIAVAAPPDQAWPVLRATDLYERPWIRALFVTRTAPDRIRARLRGHRPEGFPRTARLDEVVGEGSGFRLLAEEQGTEFVAGAIGKFWEPAIPFVDASPATFAAFREPGFGRVAWSLQVHPGAEHGSWIGIDVRVDATDEEAWRRFAPYWRLIGPFSHLIRRSLLGSLARKLGVPPPEADRVLAGDELLPSARISNTQAVTIEAPATKVWPWLVQMGCRRGGWYSIDRLDNGGVPSVDRIIPELQRITVGDVLPATPTGDAGFTVLRAEPNRVLVLGSPSLFPRAGATGRERWGLFGASYDVTWAFVLEPIGDVATRLLARVRSDFQPSLRTTWMPAVILSAHTIMEHAQLRNLKRRAERPVAAAA